MVFHAPSREDLLRLADAHHFRMDPNALADFEALLDLLLPALDDLWHAADSPAPPEYAERDPGSRPAPGTDPLNAIVRRCSVKGAATGALAGKRIGVKDNIAVAGIPMGGSASASRTSSAKAPRSARTPPTMALRRRAAAWRRRRARSADPCKRPPAQRTIDMNMTIS